MAIYRVGVRRRLVETTVVEIEAASKEEAIRLAEAADDDRTNDEMLFERAEWDLETVSYEAVFASKVEGENLLTFEVSVERAVTDNAKIIVTARSMADAARIIEAAEDPDSEHRHYLIDADWELNSEDYTVEYCDKQ